MSKEMLKLALTTKEASMLAAIRRALKGRLGSMPSLGRGGATPYINSETANEALKSAIGTSTKKNVATAAGGSLRRATGAGLAVGTAIPVLESLGLSQSSPLMWGLSGGAGVLGHDLAGWLTSRSGKGYAKHLQKISCARRDKKILLQKLSKCSTGRKKRAEMIKEGPRIEERSLTKEANYLNLLKNIAKQRRLEDKLTLGFGLGGIGAGGLGTYTLLDSLIPGYFTRRAVMETTPLMAGSMAMGGVAAAHVGKGLGRGINYIRNPKAYRSRNAFTEALSNLTKTSSLSRAAKGAIAAPLGVMGAAAIHPELFGHVQNVGILDTAAGRVLGSLDNLAKPILGDTLGQSTNALASLGGLSALGAGAGKLSERLVPVAKKSFLDDPKNKKLLLAASLFPWVSTAAGATYLINKARNSDS